MCACVRTHPTATAGSSIPMAPSTTLPALRDFLMWHWLMLKQVSVSKVGEGGKGSLKWVRVGEGESGSGVYSVPFQDVRWWLHQI